MTRDHRSSSALDLDGLEAKAKAAKTSGLPLGKHEGVPWLIRTGGSPRAVAVAWLDDEAGGTIAEFLAACDPDTVLELIAQLRNYREAANKLYALHLANDPEFQKQAAEARRMMTDAALGSPGEEGEPAE